MHRPTKEAVDASLEWASELSNAEVPFGAYTLAKEVRALREELRKWQEGEVALREPDCECHQEEGDDECPVHDARAIVARVEALCDEADKRGAPYATTLRKALKGSP